MFVKVCMRFDDNIGMMKKCSKCGIEKEITEFYKFKMGDGLQSYCKLYNSITRKQRHEKNKLRENEQTKKWHEKHKEAKRDSRLKIKFNISPEDYEQLLEEQNNVCAICGNSAGKRRLAIDHNHETQEIRGLFCIKCNTGIGLFNENVEILKLAIKYLEK